MLTDPLFRVAGAGGSRPAWPSAKLAFGSSPGADGGASSLASTDLVCLPSPRADGVGGGGASSSPSAELVGWLSLRADVVGGSGGVGRLRSKATRRQARGRNRNLVGRSDSDLSFVVSSLRTVLRS